VARAFSRFWVRSDDVGGEETTVDTSILLAIAFDDMVRLMGKPIATKK
jgi:hypothetical protein